MAEGISEFHFTDEMGGVWDLKVTGATIPRVRKLLGVNILDLINFKSKTAERFASDIEFEVNMLWAVCQPQAIMRGITEEQFAECLAGDAFYAATTALMEAVINFTPNPTVRANLHAMWQMMAQEGKKIEEALTATVNSPETRAAVAAAAKAFINSSSLAVESSESSPQK